MMQNLFDIQAVDVYADDNFNVYTTFNDGRKTVMNFADKVSRSPIMEKLRDVNNFKSMIKVYGGFVSWDIANGDTDEMIDFAPSYLYQNGQVIS